MSPRWRALQREGTVVALIAWLGACTPALRPPSDSPRSARVVVTPSSIRALSAAHIDAGLPGEIRFGGPAGRSALYLKFSAEGWARGVPERAFIALSKRSGAPRDPASVTLEAWRVSAEWQPSELVSWSDKPELLPPYSRVRVSDSLASDVRIEVTELVRFAADNPERSFGIAILARGCDGHGQSFATGMSGGRAPRLELYYAR